MGRKRKRESERVELESLSNDLLEYILEFASARDIANFLALSKSFPKLDRMTSFNSMRCFVFRRTSSDPLMKNEVSLNLSQILRRLHFREKLINNSFRPNFNAQEGEFSIDGWDIEVRGDFLFSEVQDFVFSSFDEFDGFLNERKVTSPNSTVVRHRDSLEIAGFIPDPFCLIYTSLHIYKSSNLGHFLIRSDTGGIYATHVEQNLNSAEQLFSGSKDILTKEISAFCFSVSEMEHDLLITATGRKIRIFQLDDDVVDPENAKILVPIFSEDLTGEGDITDVAVDVPGNAFGAVDSTLKLRLWDLKTKALTQTFDFSDRLLSRSDVDSGKMDLVMKEGYAIVGSNLGDFLVFFMDEEGEYHYLRTLYDRSYRYRQQDELPDFRRKIDLFYGVLISLDGGNRGISVFDLKNQTISRPCRSLQDMYDEESEGCHGLVRWSVDGSRIYFATYGGYLYSWNLEKSH